MLGILRLDATELEAHELLINLFRSRAITALATAGEPDGLVRRQHGEAGVAHLPLGARSVAVGVAVSNLLHASAPAADRPASG